MHWMYKHKNLSSKSRLIITYKGNHNHFLKNTIYEKLNIKINKSYKLPIHNSMHRSNYLYSNRSSFESFEVLFLKGVSCKVNNYLSSHILAFLS